MHKKKHGEPVAKFKIWFGSDAVNDIFNKIKYDVEMDDDKQFVHVYKKVK